MKLNRYEKAKILGARALQIAMGAPILIKLQKKDFEAFKFSPIRIAERELDESVLPITVKRNMP